MFETFTKTKRRSLELKQKNCLYNNLIRVPQKVKRFRKRKEDKISLPTKSKFALNVASSKGSSSLAISFHTRQSDIPCQLKQSISYPSFNKLPAKAFNTSWNSGQKSAVLQSQTLYSTSEEISEESMTRNRRPTEGVSTLLERPDHGDKYELNSEEIRQMLPLRKRVQGDSSECRNKNRMMTSARKASTVNDLFSYQSTSQKESVTSGSSHGTSDVYRHILGPTPDETIMAGLQTFIDMCRRRCSSSTSNGTDEDGLTTSSDYCTKADDDYLMKTLLIDTMTDNNNTKALQSGDSPRKNNSMVQLNVRRNEQCWYCNEFPKHYQAQYIVGNEEYCRCNYDQYNKFLDKAVAVHDINTSNINTHSFKETLLLDNGCQVINSKETGEPIILNEICKPQSFAQTIDVPISVQGVQTEVKYEEEIENIVTDSNRSLHHYSLGDIDSPVQMYHKPESGDIPENIYQTSSDYKASQRCNSIPEQKNYPKAKSGRRKKATGLSTNVENVKRKPLQITSFLHEPYKGHDTEEGQNDPNNDLSSLAVVISAKHQNDTAYSKNMIEKFTINSFEHEEGQIITVTDNEKDSTTSDDVSNRHNRVNSCRCLEIVEKKQSPDVDLSKSSDEEVVIGFHTIFEETSPTISGVQKSNSFHISFPKGNFPSKFHLTAKMCVNRDEMCENNKPIQNQSIIEENQESVYSDKCKSNHHHQLEIEFDPMSKGEISAVDQVKKLASNLNNSVIKLNQCPSCNTSREAFNSKHVPRNISNLNINAQRNNNLKSELVQNKKNSSKSQHTAKDSKPLSKHYCDSPEISHIELQIDLNSTPSQSKHPILEDYSHHTCSKSCDKMQEVHEITKRSGPLPSQRNFPKDNCTSCDFKYNSKGCQYENCIKNISEREMCSQELENVNNKCKQQNVSSHERHILTKSVVAILPDENNCLNPKISKLTQYSIALGDALHPPQMKTNNSSATHDEYYVELLKNNIFQNDTSKMVSNNFEGTLGSKKSKTDNKTETHINKSLIFPENNSKNKVTQSEYIQTEPKNCSSTEIPNRHKSIGLQMDSHKSKHQHKKRTNFFKKILQTFETDLVLAKDSFSSQHSRQMYPQNIKPRSYYNMKDNGLNSLKNIPKSRSYQKDLLLDPNNIHNPWIANVMLTPDDYKRSQKSLRNKKSGVHSNKSGLKEKCSPNQFNMVDKDMIKGAEEIKALTDVVKNTSSKKKAKKKDDFRVCSSCLESALTEVYKAPQKARTNSCVHKKRQFTCAPAMISPCDCHDESTRDSERASYEENDHCDDIRMFNMEPRVTKTKETSDNVLFMKSNPTASYFAAVNEKSTGGVFDFGDNKCKCGPPDIDYAFVRISKFDEYTVFEILKSTKVKPLWLHLPSTIEDIFVIKNADRKC